MPGWDPATLPLAKIFWTLFAVEIAGYGILMALAVTTGGSSPEGPVGGWIILVPPIIWAILAWLFYHTDSPSKQLVYAVLLVLPLIQIVIGPVYERVQHVMWERGWRGGDYFSGPQLTLANAIYDRDVERVKSLILGAGDLNKPYGKDTTLFDYAMSNTGDDDASFEIIRAMLAAGGNPNVPPGRPLSLALFRSPRFAVLLLDAGAEVNSLEGQRPIWWTVISAAGDSDLTTLRLLLDRGADIKQRDREGGPVAWAAYNKAWRAMWLLIERGAEWKDEQMFGQSVHQMILAALEYDRNNVPEELRLALAKYEAAATEQSSERAP